MRGGARYFLLRLFFLGLFGAQGRNRIVPRQSFGALATRAEVPLVVPDYINFLCHHIAVIHLRIHKSYSFCFH